MKLDKNISLKLIILLQNKIINLKYDPSAGSPTETLLRLLLPLNKEI